MEYQKIPKGESKFSDPINPRDCKKNMKDRVTVMEDQAKLMDESNSTDRDCENDTKDQVIDMEEFDPFNNPRNINENSFVGVAVASTVLCLVLIIFPILETSSDGRKFMEEYHDVMMVMLIPFVLFIQCILGASTMMHSVGSIFDILFMLGLSSTISIVEVSIFSWPAAIMMMISWSLLILPVVTAKWKRISSEDIVFSKGIQKFVAIICVLSIVYTIKSIVYNVYG